MTGALVLVVVLVVALPLLVLALGAALAAVMGRALTDYGEASHPGSELTGLNR